MAAYVMTLRKDTEDRAAAHFLVGCSKLLPVLVEHEARLPRWDREDPGATANFVVCPMPCLPRCASLAPLHAIPYKQTYPFISVILLQCLFIVCSPVLCPMAPSPRSTAARGWLHSLFFGRRCRQLRKRCTRLWI